MKLLMETMTSIVLAMLIQYMEDEGPTNPYKSIFIERKTVKGSILKIL